jgi:surfeit locus 1 family protein
MSTSPPLDRDGKAKPVPLSRLPRILFGARWWWATLLVIAGVTVLARLGVWQLDRLSQRRAQNAETLKQLVAPPLVLSGGVLPAVPEELRDRPAAVNGQFDYSRQIILSQQSWNGAPGVHLVTPLVIEGGDKAILVDRGWIPAREAESGNLAQYDEPDEETIRGAIQTPQTLLSGRQSAPDKLTQQWYRIDIEAIQEQMPYELLPVYLLQTPEGDVQQDLPFRSEPKIDLSDGPHLGYAIQWFLFALILAAGYIRYVSLHSGA